MHLGTVEFRSCDCDYDSRFALRRHLIADIVDCCTVHLLLSAGFDAVVLVVARPVRSGCSVAILAGTAETSLALLLE